METELEEQLGEGLQSDDESTLPATHNKLLGAVSKLYEKKRVKASTRKEPSLEVSEFHLSSSDKKRGRIKVTDLAKVLNKRAIHVEIGQKLKNAQKRAKTLPKPLEKIHADRIARAAGYEHAKHQLNRWDAIVYKQRVADQVVFPLQSKTVQPAQSTDILKIFRKPTELEIKMAELLKQPDPLAELKKSKESEVDSAAVAGEYGAEGEGEGDYPLSLAELVEKRKQLARLRAQQSYRQTKAARHSKIKSKKFHQIQRRARVKEQLREFEELQKKDPEAALKKLEELERTRAEERMTLRHRSTGQWAKNLSVRAKFDKDARIALAEQLSKSRELTVKLTDNQDSESEKEEEVEAQPEPETADPNNPWVVKRSKEMEDFVSGYRKYWETQEKGQEKTIPDTTVNVNDFQEENAMAADKENNKPEENSAADSFDKENDKPEENSAADSFDEENDKPEENSAVYQSSEVSFGNTSHSKNYFEINDASLNEKVENNKSPLKFDVSNADEPTANCSTIKTNNSRKSNGNNCSKIQTKTGSWDVTPTKRNERSKKGSEQKTVKKLNDSFKVTKIKVLREVNSSGVDSHSVKTIEKSNVEEMDQTDDKSVGRALKIKSLDEMFEEIEDKMQLRIKNKIERLREELSRKRKNEEESEKESETEDVPSLELKKAKVANVDEELIEQWGDQDKTTNPDLNKSTATKSTEVKSTDDIDPNKFLKVTPRRLASELPEMMSEGEDALDDEEKTAEDRHLTIAEAFADDDVVDQFQKEKEDEVKKGSVADVDLSLPGWGSWAGHNMRPVARRKRKKFVIKFPKAIPRRDTNRGNVIINEDADKPIKEHQVSEIPFPFTSVREYEASVRTPLGRTFVPETAHAKLTQPPVITKMGTIIEPMNETQLASFNRDKQLPTNIKKNKRKNNIGKVNK